MISTEAQFRSLLSLGLSPADEPTLSAGDIELLFVQAKRYDTGHNAPDAYDAWLSSTQYANGALVVPDPRNGYVYQATQAGSATSGTVQPAWPTTLNQTVTDNGVTWKCLATSPWLGAWDLDAALEAGWNLKADRLAPLINTHLRDGTTEDRALKFDHATKQASSYRRRRLVNAGLGITPYADRGY